MYEKGILYVMTTAVSGLTKIGTTKTENYGRTMYDLERNGYRNVAGLKRKFAIEVEDYKRKEEVVRRVYEKSRLANMDLFAVDANEAIRLLVSFEGDVVYPKSKTKRKLFDETFDVAESEEDESQAEIEREDESFTVRLFLKELTTFDRKSKTTRAELRRAYDEYCKGRGFHVSSPQTLYKVLKTERIEETGEVKYPEKKIRGERYFANIRIK